MKSKKISLVLLVLCSFLMTYGKEIHVSKAGKDSNSGTSNAPLLTIQAAAYIAQAGDIITVHEGVYRERIDPIRGGNSHNERIVYRAAKDEKVEIKGSEVISGWKKVKKSVWKVVIPNSFFGNYNPFVDSVYGDWFNNQGRIHHTGDVYLNGTSLYEMETLDKVSSSKNTMSGKTLGNGYTWYCRSNEELTTIWANFHDYNPNKELTEISVRNTCFYPSKPGINYITIDGFEISQAATQWGAPTAEQVGMVATHWNKGWIIENNTIHDTKCSGVTLGKEIGTGHNVWLADRSKDGSVHYIEVIFRALRNGWSKKNIGSHVVRNNEIYNCEQTAICGSFGAAFSIIENNHFHHIWIKRQFAGAEIAGLKFHGAIDVQIRKNRVNNCGRGFWLDWMTQGVRISQNVLYNNSREDMYFEVNHGPFLVDNNILLSKVGAVIQSNGGAFIHNLFIGETKIWAEPSRFTPYQLPHSTEVAGVSGISSGDNHFYNNIFVGIGKGKGYNEVGINTFGLSTLNDSIMLAWGNLNKEKIKSPSYVENNVYLNGAQPYKDEKQSIIIEDFNPEISLNESDKELYLTCNFNVLDLETNSDFISTSTLGKTKISNAKFDNPDGSELIIDEDYHGLKRVEGKTMFGPFQNLEKGVQKIHIWE